MQYEGSCSCRKWKVLVNLPSSINDFNPRVCDCSFCQSNPSAVISDPEMEVVLQGSGLTIAKIGDQLANFYSCIGCGDILAVGRDFDGQLRGAVNSNLLLDRSLLGPSVAIQPRFLSADEKLDRWGKLWGALKVVETSISKTAFSHDCK